MRKKDTFFFLVMISFILPLSTLFSQETGKIYGIVKDAATGEALIGANVTLAGTSMGAPSGVDGKYVFYGVPAGSYKMVIRYIGYKGQELQIEMRAGVDLEKSFSLVPQAIEGEEVVVLAQARGQKSAINQQIASSTISSIVSSERIRELPDASAAAALSRLPGVSLMNGDQVVIRGIQAKLNTVLINGIQLPSTDMTNRSTGLGFISSNMLSGIEVIKTLTPDMDANTIGGVVNLRLREAPSGFKADVFAQGSYNNQDKNPDNNKFWASVSDRFFDDKLGVFIQGNADRNNGGADIARATTVGEYKSGDEWFFGKMDSFTFEDQVQISNNNGGSIILDYTLPKGKLVLQNTYAHGLNNNINFVNTLNFKPNATHYNAVRNKYAKDMYINVLQGEYTFGDIKAELTLSHSYTNQYTYIRYGDPGENFDFTNPFHDPYGLDDSGRVKTYNQALLTPDDVYKIHIEPTDADSSVLSGWIMQRNEAFTQHLYNTSLDVTIPISFSTEVSSKFKVGGKFYRTVRYNDVDNWFTGSSDPDAYDKVHFFVPGKYLTNQPQRSRLMFSDIMDNNYQNQRGQYYLGGAYSFKYALNRDKYDEFITLSRTGWGSPSMHYARSFADDFQGAEIFSAGYLMGTFDIGTKLTIIAGARFEHYNMKYHANWDFVTHSVYGDAVLIDTLNNVDRNDDNIFPNAQVRYKLTDWADIRVAYSTGISRPDYRAIVPSTYYSPGESASAGNPKLKPALATAYDLSVSVYSDKIGLFTVSPFYKKIENMFYRADIFYKNLSSFNVSFPDSAFFQAIDGVPPGASLKIGSYVNNTEPGYVKGIELDWQTNFWYLPKPLNGLVLNINYTKTWSDMAYNQVLNIAERYRDTTGPRPVWKNNYITRDTVYHSRLLNQANDVLNIALGIDYKDFSGRISLNMQGNVITSLSTTAYHEGDEFTGNIYRWDFTLQQKLPVEGLSIMLSGINIFHNPVNKYQKFKKYGSTELTENLVSTSYYPSVFELTLRYSM
jgi:TonB-dependent receptor